MNDKFSKHIIHFPNGKEIKFAPTKNTRWSIYDHVSAEEENVKMTTKKAMIRKIRRLGQRYETSLKGIGPLVLIGKNFRSKGQVKTYHQECPDCSPDKCYQSSEPGEHYCYDGGFLYFTIEDVIRQSAGSISEILFGTPERWKDVMSLYNSLK